MTTKTVKLVLKSPIKALESNLLKKGITLQKPYQRDGIEWLMKREKETTTKSKKKVECAVCSYEISEDRMSDRGCCKADICQECIDEWSNQNDTCPYCRQDLLFKVDRMVYGGLLCDEMGLGKTLQMICLMKVRKLPFTLVVLPPSILRQWMGEFSKFAPEIKVVLNYGESRPTKDYILKNHGCVVLTSYSMCLQKNSIIHEIHWDRIVLDECHMIRNKNSKIHKAILRIRATNKWGITGTPMQNYRSDFISLLRFIGIAKFKFSDNEITRFGRQFMLRRTKAMVEKHNEKLKMPELSIQKIPLDFKTDKERQFYDHIRERTIGAMKNYKFNPVHAFEMILRMKQVSILPQLVIDGYSKKWSQKFDNWCDSNTKIEFITEDIINKKNSDSKFNAIVFCEFRGEMEFIDNVLSKNNFKVDFINGSVSLAQRHNIITSSRKGEIDILLIQINAGGTGLNLQHINNVYFTSPSWNPALKNQAIARSHRLGQKNKVNVYMPLIKDTIDFRISELQDSKESMFDKLINII